MRILIVSDSYLPRLGGAEIYAYKLGHFLQQKGHEVMFCVTELERDFRDKEFISVNRLVFHKYSVFRTIKSFFILFRLLRGVDMVHCIYSHKLAAIVGFMRFFIRVPQVITLEGRGILDLPHNDFVHRLIHSFYRWFSLRRASLVIASSREFLQLASKYTDSAKIKYQPNAVDIKEFYPRDKNYSLLPFRYNNEILVATIRRLVPKNGIQFLIETIPYIISDFKNVKFILIGWGRLEEYLKNRVRELSIDQYVYFLGKIDNKQLSDYLNLADIVVFPSTAESTSLACLESMSLAKPIVASMVGGYLEMVRDGYNGFLVNLTDDRHSNYYAPMDIPENKKLELSNKILFLLRSEEKREYFGRNSREIVKNRFSWQVSIEKILEWYNTIL